MFTLAELESVIPVVRASVPPTPQYAWPLLKARTGVDVVVKHENHTPIGSFKVRGGIVYFDRLKRRRPRVRGIVTATHGNHGHRSRTQTCARDRRSRHVDVCPHRHIVNSPSLRSLRESNDPIRRNCCFDSGKRRLVTARLPVAEEHDVTRLTRERDEALEQQTAISEVLRVISASPGELEPVFQAMLERAVRICGAKFGNIYRWDGEALHILASHNTPPAFAEAVRRSLRRAQYAEIREIDRTIQLDSLAILEQVMRHFFWKARILEGMGTEGGYDAVDRAWAETGKWAKEVAQFRHPKIESIRLGGDPNAPLLPENMTLDELRDSILVDLERLRERGVLDLPRISEPPGHSSLPAR
jgi:hypothetical protein